MTDAGTEPSGSAQSPWRRRVILGVLLVALAVAGYFFATSFLPRWWSQRAGSFAHKQFRWGVWWGLVFGVVCTVVPALVARQAMWRQIRWKARAWIIVLALLLAAPNLMTLGIVAGGGSGAHAGRRTLDTDAPGFRGATLAGVIIGAALLVVAEVVWAGRRRRRQELTRLRVEKKIRDVQEDE
jgi:MFS family permease